MVATGVFGSQVNIRPGLFIQHFEISSFPRNLKFSCRKTAKKIILRATNLDYESGRCRPFLELPPSAWGDYFLSLPVNQSEMDALAREIDELKPKVKDMLMSFQEDEKTKICLIHLLHSLGISYHFENEIEETLKHAFEKIKDLVSDTDDLYTISIMFQVFRTYGHNMSSDVFKNFKGEDGKFKKSEIMDAKGMLSLYEAANWGTTTEYIMDEALSFTLEHMDSLATQASPHISKLIQNIRFLPRRYNTTMLYARGFISFYEQEEDHNEMLLKFAKLNFKFLQLHYINELKTLTKWWKDLDLRSKLPHYFRDGVVESFFMALTVYFEPRFSLGRIVLTKLFMVLTIMDDSCDRYASVPEVASLVDNFNRWDAEDVDGLPDYLKIVFKFVLDIVEECATDMELESYSVQCLVEEVKTLVRTQLPFAKWAQGVQLPNFDEFLEIGGVEVTTYSVILFSFVGMGKIVGREAYDWLKSRPKIAKSIATKGLLMNNMTGFKSDMDRGYAATAINIYMNQFGVNEEEAFRELGKMVRDADKIINEEFFKEIALPRRMLLRVFYCGQMIDVFYRLGEEGYTNPEGKTKEHITSLFVDFMDI